MSFLSQPLYCRGRLGDLVDLPTTEAGTAAPTDHAGPGAANSLNPEEARRPQPRNAAPLHSFHPVSLQMKGVWMAVAKRLMRSMGHRADRRIRHCFSWAEARSLGARRRASPWLNRW